MTWTLILILTVGWLLGLLGGLGSPWSWIFPAAAGALLLYRMVRARRRR